MKKLIIFALLLILSKSASAEIALAVDVPDNKHAFDSIVKLAEMNKSDLKQAYVFRYNANRFDADIAATKILNEHEVKMKKDGKSCQYKITTGARENISLLRTDNVNKELSEKIAALLEVLDDQAQLLTIVSAIWDGETGSTSQCSGYEFYAFSVDGYKLIIEFKK